MTMNTMTTTRPEIVGLPTTTLDANAPKRIRGTMKWFDAKKGYGFVTVPEGGRDIFVHINCLPEGVDGLKDGQIISFEVEMTRKGPRAVSVLVEV